MKKAAGASHKERHAAKQDRGWGDIFLRPSLRGAPVFPPPLPLAAADPDTTPGPGLPSRRRPPPKTTATRKSDSNTETTQKDRKALQRQGLSKCKTFCRRIRGHSPQKQQSGLHRSTARPDPRNPTEFHTLLDPVRIRRGSRKVPESLAFLCKPTSSSFTPPLYPPYYTFRNVTGVYIPLG